jgi:small subunit ribosomal protein S17
MAAPTPVAERNRRQTVVGIVVSDKMQKTVVVEINRLTRHGGYTKLVRRKTRVKAHDEQGACHEGDTVRLMETRPISEDKRWRVVEVVARAV